ncbi:hypothetical protein QUB60_06680 [Microcoleus sp. A2-C5]|uniref:hypothetical protein n=1 Tax=unclassified Microcoleus TaxID=2642155 RepID=UPI002FD71C0F
MNIFAIEYLSITGLLGQSVTKLYLAASTQQQLQKRLAFPEEAIAGRAIGRIFP